MLPIMDRDQILARLRDHAPNLRRHGVVRAALFGSIARGEARPDSDIDIMVELDHEIVRTLFDYVGVKLVIEDLFEAEVDVVDRQGLKPDVRPFVMADSIYAF